MVVKVPRRFGESLQALRPKRRRSIVNQQATAREADKRFKLVKDLYGDRLDDEQLEEVRKGVQGIVAVAEELRAIKLDNGSEPFSVFAPFRREG